MSHDVIYFPPEKYFSDRIYVCPMDPSEPSESRFVHRSQIASIGHICNFCACLVMSKRMTCLIMSLILSPFHVLSPFRSAIPFRHSVLRFITHSVPLFRSAFYPHSVPPFRFRVLSQPVPGRGT